MENCCLLSIRLRHLYYRISFYTIKFRGHTTTPFSHLAPPRPPDYRGHPPPGPSQGPPRHFHYRGRRVQWKSPTTLCRPPAGVGRLGVGFRLSGSMGDSSGVTLRDKEDVSRDRRPPTGVSADGTGRGVVIISSDTSRSSEGIYPPLDVTRGPVVGSATRKRIVLLRLNYGCHWRGRNASLESDNSTVYLRKHRRPSNSPGNDIDSGFRVEDQLGVRARGVTILSNLLWFWYIWVRWDVLVMDTVYKGEVEEEVRIYKKLCQR